MATDVTVPGGLIKVSGDDQTAPANTALLTPLTVAVVNQFGQTLQNVTVNWIISSGGGSLSSSAMLSDEGGLASVTYHWADGWTSHHQGASEWSTGPRVQHPHYLAKAWRRRIQDEDIPRGHEVSAENII